MISLRGKLTRELVERKSPTPIATRSALASSPPRGGTPGGVTPAPSTDDGKVSSGGTTGESSGASGEKETPLSSTAQTPQKTGPKDVSGDVGEGLEISQIEGLSEEWTWKGVWAFGSLSDDDCNNVGGGEVTGGEGSGADKSAAKTGESDVGTSGTGADAAARKEGESSSPVPPRSNPLRTSSSSSTWKHKLSSEADNTTCAGEAENKNETKNETTAADAQKDKDETAPASDGTKEKSTKDSETTKKETTTKQPPKMKPRPFSYRFTKFVNAVDVTVPSFLIAVMEGGSAGGSDAEKSSMKKDGRGSSSKSNSQTSTKDSASEAKSRPEPLGSATKTTDKKSSASDAKAASESSATSSTQRTYGDPPYTDAGKEMEWGTCPKGGKWEGHFENVVPGPVASKKKKEKRDNRVREQFYLFFNATPPSGAKTCFGDAANASTGAASATTKVEDNENKEKYLLQKNHVHVRGMGTNRFGTFEIVGSYDPHTGILHCQRMYVMLPTPEEDRVSKAATRSQRRSLTAAASSSGLGADGDVGDEEVGRRGSSSRKRKSTWKMRDKDPFGDQPLLGIELASSKSGSQQGAAGAIAPITPVAASASNVSEKEVAPISQPRKRGRPSNSEVNAGKTTPVTTPLPQCASSESSSRRVSVSKSITTISVPPLHPLATKASTPTAPAPRGSGIQLTVDTKTPASKKAKISPVKGPIAGSVMPLDKVPTIPSTGDPMLARWRAAHYLYYQRIDTSASADGQGLSGAGGDLIPTFASGGSGSSKVNFVVYEGEMHDSLREGRGICLYNNNTLYEGQWKRNKEHGKGTLMTADRSRKIYEGDWERGRMHGHGTYYYYKETPYGAPYSGKEEGKYIGEFRENLRNGSGVYNLPDGSTYDGEWRENNPNGWGIFRWPDGSVYEGFWKEGRRHGSNGTLVASDGFRYEGAWVNNAMEGRGVATYPKGQIYEGMWVGGKREGRGTIRFNNGAIYEGRFKDDYMEGQGTMKMIRNVVVPRLKSEEERKGSSQDGENQASSEKNDWMIPIEFQSDISHIHQKAGFTTIGL